MYCVIPNLCSSEVMIAIHSFIEAISVCCAVLRNLGWHMSRQQALNLFSLHQQLSNLFKIYYMLVWDQNKQKEKQRGRTT